MSTALGCPKCKSLRLSLAELQLEHHIFDEGLVLDGGVIYPVGDGYSAPGDVLAAKTVITCQNCGHHWHPRRRFDPAKTGDDS